MGVAQVGGEGDRLAVGGDALAIEPVASFLAEVGEHGGHAVQIVVGRALGEGPGVVVLELGGEEAVGGSGAGVGRHNDRLDAEQVGHVDGVHGAGAAVGDQGEIARVVPAFDADVADGADHGVVGDFQDAAGRGGDVQVDAGGDCVGDGVVGGLDVQNQLAAGNLRADAAEDDVGIGDGGQVRAPAVAGRAGVGAGAVGADGEAAVG